MTSGDEADEFQRLIHAWRPGRTRGREALIAWARIGPLTPSPEHDALRDAHLVRDPIADMLLLDPVWWLDEDDPDAQPDMDRSTPRGPTGARGRRSSAANPGWLDAGERTGRHDRGAAGLGPGRTIDPLPPGPSTCFCSARVARADAHRPPALLTALRMMATARGVLAASRSSVEPPLVYLVAFDAGERRGTESARVVVRGVPAAIGLQVLDVAAFPGALRMTGWEAAGRMLARAELVHCGLCGLPLGDDIIGAMRIHPLAGTLTR